MKIVKIFGGGDISPDESKADSEAGDKGKVDGETENATENKKAEEDTENPDVAEKKTEGENKTEGTEKKPEVADESKGEKKTDEKDGETKGEEKQEEKPDNVGGEPEKAEAKPEENAQDKTDGKKKEEDKKNKDDKKKSSAKEKVEKNKADLEAKGAKCFIEERSAFSIPEETKNGTYDYIPFHSGYDLNANKNFDLYCDSSLTDSEIIEKCEKRLNTNYKFYKWCEKACDVYGYAAKNKAKERFSAAHPGVSGVEILFSGEVGVNRKASLGIPYSRYCAVACVLDEAQAEAKQAHDKQEAENKENFKKYAKGLEEELRSELETKKAELVATGTYTSDELAIGVDLCMKTKKKCRYGYGDRTLEDAEKTSGCHLDYKEIISINKECQEYTKYGNCYYTGKIYHCVE